jgi:hypothetical protein
MNRTCTVLIAICLVVSGCATKKGSEKNIISEKNTIIVMAKEVDKGKGATHISDVFTYEGNIYVYATFRWDDPDRPAGQYTIKAKWFNSDKLISTGQHAACFARTPHYVWLQTRGTSMGPGKCRVDVYANDIYVGSKSFTVVEE